MASFEPRDSLGDAAEVARDPVREGLYESFNPLAITADFCAEEPIKAAACSALLALFGVSDLLLAEGEGDNEPRRLFAAMISLERALLGLYITLDNEPVTSSVFSNLHDQPITVGGPAPSYIEGVYLWLSKAAKFLRVVALFGQEGATAPEFEKDPERFLEYAAYHREKNPWPESASESDFAKEVLEKIAFSQIDVLEIATGIKMEVYKLGIDMPESLYPENPTGQPDSKPDSRKKTSTRVPQNPEVSKLALFIKKNDRDGETMIGLARDYSGGNEKKSKKLKRSASWPLSPSTGRNQF